MQTNDYIEDEDQFFTPMQVLQMDDDFYTTGLPSQSSIDRILELALNFT